MADYIPTDLVLKLSAQGRSEEEIITQLRLQGFTPKQIDGALKEAIKKEVVSPAQPKSAPPQPLGLEAPKEIEETTQIPRPRVSAGPQAIQVSRRPPTPQSPPPQPPPPAVQQRPPPQPAPTMNIQAAQPVRGAPVGIPPEKIVFSPEMRPPMLSETSGRQYQSTSEVSIEELIEAIVNERWIKFEEKLSTYDARDVNLQQQIQELKKQTDQMRGDLKQRETTLVEKLDEFGGSLEKTQVRIGSIESAFREFVPTLSENVKGLAEVVDRLKKTK